MIPVLWVMLRKELREFARDRRMLLLTCLMPLVFYPAATILFSYLSARQELRVREAPVVAAVVGTTLDGLWDQPGAPGWTRAFSDMAAAQSALQAGEVDVVLDGALAGDSWQVVVHGRGTATGELAIKRVRAELGKLEERMVRQRLAAAGVDVGILAPVKVVVVDQAGAREVLGSRFGGVVGYFLMFLAFTGCMATAVDVLAGEKERGTLEAVLATGVNPRWLLLAKLLFVTCSGMLAAGCAVVGLVVAARVVGDGDVHAALQAMVDGPTVAVIGLLVLVATLMFAAVMLNFSLLARSAREAHGWSSPLLLVTSLVMIYAMLSGVSSSGALRWAPVVNVSLAVRDALAGSLAPGLLATALVETLALCAAAVGIGARLARREGILVRR